MTNAERRAPAFVLSVILSTMWFAAWLLLIAFMCLIGISFVHDIPGAELGIHARAAVNTEAIKISAPSMGISNARIDDMDARVVLKFPPPSRSSLTVVALVPITGIAAALWALAQLRALVRTIRDGRPFVAENAGRIRRLAYALAGAELASATFTYFGDAEAARAFSADGLQFIARPEVNVAVLVAALVILVLSEVFRMGTKLDEEQSLTV